MKISFDKRKNKDLILSGSLLTAIMVLAIPTVLNSLIQTMYNLTDTFWLGRIGTDQMAAITLVSPVQNIVVLFGQGLTTAGAILIAQYIGAKDEKSSHIMVNHIFVSTMFFAFFATILCVFGTPFVIRWLGATGTIYEYSKTYLQIVMLDMPFLFLINLYASVNQAQGDALRPMLLNLVGVVINMILDPFFLVTLGWGTAGAALATLLAKVPCAAIALWSLFKQTNPIHVNLHHFKFEKEKLFTIIKIGLPTAIGKSTMQLGFLLMSKNVLAYGPIAVSAYGIGNKINSLITMPVIGMGSATGTIVSQNFGANQKDRADQTYKLATRISVVFLLVTGLVLSRTSVSSPLVRIFTQDKEVIALGTEFLCVLSLWSFTNGVYNNASSLFQGSGHTMITMIVDASRLWIFRFASLYFCESILHMGVQSIWYSVVISNGLAALAFWILYKLQLWKKDVIKVSNNSSTTPMEKKVTQSARA